MASITVTSSSFGKDETSSADLMAERALASKADGVSLNMVIHQDPFSITLDAWALLALSITVVLAMQSMKQHILSSLILAVPLLLLVHNDYQNFLRLGPGGTPPTFGGYVRLTWYRLFALRDVFSSPVADRTRSPSAGILDELPYRPGPRPLVAGLAPQRQLDQQASVECYNKLRKAIEDLTKRNPQLLSTATSCIEKHGFALFARHPVNVWGQGEICHIHDSEKSMHMSLHPDDIKEILKKGWGERHPLAFTGWVRAPLPATFVMIYAPRDESDLKNVCRVIEAAIWYTMAQKMELVLA